MSENIRQAFLVSAYSDDINMPTSEVVLASSKVEVRKYYENHRQDMEVHSILDREFLENILAVIDEAEKAKPNETLVREAVPLIRLENAVPVKPEPVPALQEEDGGF